MGLRRIELPAPSAWPPPSTHEAIGDTLRYARLRDPIGHAVHFSLALLYLFMLAIAPAPNSIAFAVLLGYTVLRLPHTWRTYTWMVRDRLGWLMIAWTAWHALSIFWSTDARQGLDELQTYRVILTPFMLWPVIDRVAWMIGAYLFGVFVQNLAQFGQGLDWLERKSGDGARLRGLLHPIQTGAICIAAMCWHLPVVLRGRGLVWLLSLVGFVVATAGLVLSGSRGPWIAAAIVIPLAMVTIAFRRPEARLMVVILTVGVALATFVAWPLINDFVDDRVEAARSDLEHVIEGDYQTNLGVRVISWIEAWNIFLERPLHGAGAGGYREAVQHPVMVDRQANHAHSLYLHVLACTGAIGGIVVLAIVVLSLVRAVRASSELLYAEGTLFVLLSWLIGAAFDCYQLNSHLFGLFAFILVLIVPKSFSAKHE